MVLSLNWNLTSIRNPSDKHRRTSLVDPSRALQQAVAAHYLWKQEVLKFLFVLPRSDMLSMHGLLWILHINCFGLCMEVLMKKRPLSVSARDAFTLIELMIVIAIIAIITAIAIPNLLESRKAANETSAIGMVRAINAAQVMFRTRGSRQEYGDVKELIFQGYLTFNSVQLTKVFPPGVGPVEGVAQGYAFAIAPGVDLGNMEFLTPEELINSGNQTEFSEAQTEFSEPEKQIFEESEQSFTPPPTELSFAKSLAFPSGDGLSTAVKKSFNQKGSGDFTQQFVVFARPQVQTQTGDRTFCSGHRGVIRFTTLPIQDLFGTNPNFLIQTHPIGGK
jgi:prepilin-type N-terminal cleavage/methylation domain-containing protein